jgi:hypothetical protein
MNENKNDRREIDISRRRERSHGKVADEEREKKHQVSKMKDKRKM